MSFDIVFQPFRFTGAAEVKTNPFTGKTETIVANEPLNAIELKAVRHVFSRAGAAAPDSMGCYVVRLRDGGYAEIHAEELATGCMFAVRGMSAAMIEFLFEVLKAGNWAMLPAMENAVAIATTPDALQGAPEHFPRGIVCESATELGSLLLDGVQAWEQYRGQVTGDDER